VSRTTFKIRFSATQGPRPPFGFDKLDRFPFGQVPAEVRALRARQRWGELKPDDFSFHYGCRIHDGKLVESCGRSNTTLTGRNPPSSASSSAAISLSRMWPAQGPFHRIPIQEPRCAFARPGATAIQQLLLLWGNPRPLKALSKVLPDRLHNLNLALHRQCSDLFHRHAAGIPPLRMRCQ